MGDTGHHSVGNPGNHTMGDPTHKYLLYQYTPSLAGGIIALVLFFLTTCFHTYQVCRTRTWYFIPFVIGGFFECIGFIGRVLGSQEEFGQWSLGPFVIQSMFLLLAPAMFAASIYMVLGRIIIGMNGSRYSIISPRWLTKIFVSGDILSFLTQGAGGGVLSKAKTDSDRSLGQNIITAGLAVQVLFFGIFIVVTTIFHARANRHSVTESHIPSPTWKRYLNILYATSALILIRSVFRIVEYVQGNDGYILSHEVFLYIFDSLLMFVTMVLFNIWHPSTIVQGRVKIPSSPSNTYAGKRDEYPLVQRDIC